jgi:hypothetical protein
VLVLAMVEAPPLFWLNVMLWALLGLDDDDAPTSTLDCELPEEVLIVGALVEVELAVPLLDELES